MSTRLVTLLGKVGGGDTGAVEELMPLVYDELRRMARSHTRHQPQGHTLQPTALGQRSVHQAVRRRAAALR